MMGLWESLTRPEEFLALLRFKLYPDLVFKSGYDQKHMSPTLQRCFELLRITGKSVELVTRLLDNPVRDYVCLAYLLLRTLDAIEEDLTIPTEKRVTMMKSFYKAIDDPHWSYPNSNERHGISLKEFPTISCEVRKLPPDQRKMLADMCQKAGEMLAINAEKGITSMEDLLEYFRTLVPVKDILQVAVDHLGENKAVLKDTWLIEETVYFWFGTDHVKDIYEDLTTAGAIQWPKVMWGKYVSNAVALTHPKNKEKALAFCNEIITFCLKRIPHIILLTSRLDESKTFYFFAVTEVMAIATLERLYNNYQVYSGDVKIRKGETIRLILEAKSLDKLKAIFQHYVKKIMRRIPEEDPNAAETRLACQKALVACRTKAKFETHTKMATLFSVGLALLVPLIFAYIVSYFYF